MVHIKRDGNFLCGRMNKLPYKNDSHISFGEAHKIAKFNTENNYFCKNCLKVYFDKCSKALFVVK